jgi:hypothetical protein
VWIGDPKNAKREGHGPGECDRVIGEVLESRRSVLMSGSQTSEDLAGLLRMRSVHIMLNSGVS